MTVSLQNCRIVAVAVSLLASTTALAGQKPKGRDGMSKSPLNRGILHGIDLSRFRDLQVVEEEVPADAPTIVLLDDATKARGRAASHVTEAFVYRNFSAGRNNQTAFFFNWKSTIGGGDGQQDADCPGGLAQDCFSPAVTVPGIFHADGAIFGGGFKANDTPISSYEIFAFRSSSDPDTLDSAFVQMELWDGDPHNALDSTGVGECSDGALCKVDADCDRGACTADNRPCAVDTDCATAGNTCTITPGVCGAHFSAGPIPGTRVTFSNVPFFTKIVFRGELDPPVVMPHGRAWVVVTSDACRFGWLLSRNSPEVGSDDQARLDALTGSTDGLLELQLDSNGDSNGLGVCCGDDCDGAPCDLSVGMACCDDPTGSRNQCVDGDAEDLTLGNVGGPCSGDPFAPGDGCSNFWLNVLAEANVTMTFQPTGNGALGALAAGARIEGNEIIMRAGGENVLMDIQISNFDPTPLTELRCVGGNFAGAPCAEATEVADCGPVDPHGDNGPPSFGCGLKMRAYLSEIDSTGYTSGIVGEMTVASISCATGDDCVAAVGGACSFSGDACTATSQCALAVSPLNETCDGAGCTSSGSCKFVFINSKRADYAFRGLDELAAVDDIFTPDFRWGSVLNGPAIRPPDPFPAGGLNTGELVMHTSADAKGTFTLNLKPVPLSFLLDAQNQFIDLLGFVPAKITVSTGQCCNLGLATPVCVTDQVTAAGCAELGANNGFSVNFDPTKTCADPCPVSPQCFPTDAPLAEPTVTPKNRYLSFLSGNLHRQTAVQVTFVDLPAPHDAANGRTMWLGPPETIVEDGGNRLPAAAPGSPTFVVARLQCEPFVTDWGALGTINVYHEGIVPGGTYEVREVGSSCAFDDPTNLSAPLALGTSSWGDVVSNCATTPCGPPNGTVDVALDAVALLDKFSAAPGAVTKARADLEPSLPDQRINITDITRVLDAFGGAPFPFTGPGAIDPCSP